MKKITTQTYITEEFETILGRTAYICGDYVYVSSFDYDKNLPITNGMRTNIFLNINSNWKNAHPLDLFLESLRLGFYKKINNLKEFREFSKQGV
tara:strand:+ start:178 stop:459 length:282 start_codon:yes stop_codon:yes gene_type:complete